MQQVIRIHRHDPGRFPDTWVDEFTLEVDETDRILDLLRRIRDDHDGSLAFRASCGHGVCGSDGMMIQGINRLACQTFAGDFGGSVTIAPLKGYPVIRDLVVDLEPFMEKYLAVEPWVEADEWAPGLRESLQSPADLERIEELTTCIMCSCCTSACPSMWLDPDYLGPAAMVQAARFVMDTRNSARERQLANVAVRNGIYRCHTAANCGDACPRGIDVTGAMGAIKRMLFTGPPDPEPLD